MNKDDSGITAKDAAAPAVAPTDERTPLDRVLDILAEDAPISDVVELSEHFETDAELAELSVRLLNLSQGLSISSTYEDDAKVERAVSAQRSASFPSLLLMSRALMRSAAAHERMAASNEHARRAEEERRAIRDEADRLHLDNLRLQNQAFRGHVDRLSAVAQYAVSFAQDIRAGRLTGSAAPQADIIEFANALLRLAGEELSTATTHTAATSGSSSEQPA